MHEGEWIMTGRRERGAVALVLALMLGVAGCNGSGSDAGRDRSGRTEQRVPAGYIDVKDAEMGFALAIPRDWQQVPLNAETLKQQADAVRAQHPELADSLESAQSLVGPGRLFAIHPDGLSNVNVIVNDAQGASVEDLVGPAADELRTRGGEVQSQERTTVGGEPAVKTAVRFRVTPETTVDAVQYYVVKRGRVFVLTLTGRDPALDIIPKSLRLT